MNIRIEFKPQDLWIGAFWKVTEMQAGYYRTLHVWICLLPMLPIHISREYVNTTGRRLDDK